MCIYIYIFLPTRDGEIILMIIIKIMTGCHAADNNLYLWLEWCL